MLLGLVTETRYASGGSRESIHNRNIGVRYGADSGLVYTLGLAGSDLGATAAKRIALSADYFLSKQTDLYLYAVRERAEGAGARAVLFTTVPSGNNRQYAVAAGIRHKF
jgi:predicted porin